MEIEDYWIYLKLLVFFACFEQWYFTRLVYWKWTSFATRALLRISFIAVKCYFLNEPAQPRTLYQRFAKYIDIYWSLESFTNLYSFSLEKWFSEQWRKFRNFSSPFAMSFGPRSVYREKFITLAVLVPWLTFSFHPTLSFNSKTTL